MSDQAEHDTDRAEARRIEARRKVAKRKQLQVRAERLATVEAARAEARRLKGESDSAASRPLGSEAEEIDALMIAVRWMAAEARASRVEVADRLALHQETGRRFRTDEEERDARERAEEEDR
ncbi:MAG TPA: hypothetical protein VN903_25505 [Polyangia bacterium]|nr:hypothetical protein [Polyangia bacterium]